MTKFPPKVKYVLVPGWVTSEKDGQKHYVGHRDLIRLYKPPLGSFMLVRDHPDIPTFLREAKAAGLVPLYARADGDYTLPKVKERVGIHDLAGQRGTAGQEPGEEDVPSPRRKFSPRKDKG